MIEELLRVQITIKNYEKNNLKSCFCWHINGCYLSMQFVKKHGWFIRQHDDGFDVNNDNTDGYD